MTAQNNAPAGTAWHSHYFTDGWAYRPSVLREYLAENLLPALRWYGWDVKRHPVLWLALAAGRLLAWVALLRAAVVYCGVHQVAGLAALTLRDGFALAQQAPLAALLVAGSFAVRFRKITFWLRHQGRS